MKDIRDLFKLYDTRPDSTYYCIYFQNTPYSPQSANIFFLIFRGQNGGFTVEIEGLFCYLFYLHGAHVLNAQCSIKMFDVVVVLMLRKL